MVVGSFFSFARIIRTLLLGIFMNGNGSSLLVFLLKERERLETKEKRRGRPEISISCLGSFSFPSCSPFFKKTKSVKMF